MNGNKILLDTNAILYLLAGDTSFLPVIHGKDIILSFISEIELLSSNQIDESERKAIQRFLDKCLIFDMFPAIKENTILFRKKYNLKLPDAVIVATAYTFDVPLLTADRKLFVVDELEIVKIAVKK
jgi:hypothetical protein